MTTRILPAILFLLFTLNSATAEEPTASDPKAPTKLNLFEARENGYYTYRIPGLLVTKAGSVLASVEARKGKGGDWDPIDIQFRRSIDGGKTWSVQRCLVDHDTYGKGPISNFVMISDNTGVVHALFIHDYARVFYLHSEDDGATFSAPVEITDACAGFRKDYPWTVIATGPAHGIQIRSGRLVVPVWLSDGSGTEFGKGHRGHRPSVVSALYSDDHGKTWQCGEIVCRGTAEIVNPNETTLVELSDGRVLFNMRSESKAHRRLISSSPNGATQWTNPEFDAGLLDPVCMASLLRFDAKRIIFANPDNREKPDSPKVRSRERLTLKLSTDDAKTWTSSRVLEPGLSAYSDLSVLPDGTILCLYENGGLSSPYDTKSVTLARFGIEWLEAGHE